MIIDTASLGFQRRMEKIDYVFGHDNKHFTQGKPDWNEFYATRAKHYFTDMLAVKGYIFLNEVLIYLGLEPRAIGQLVGWTYKRGEGFVDIQITKITEDGVVSLEIKPEGVIFFDVLED